MKTSAAVQSFLYNRRSLNRRPVTIRWYEKNLKRFVDLYPDELPSVPEDLEQFLSEIVSDEKDEARHAYYRTLRALYRFICRRQRIPNPMDFIDPPTRRKKVRPTLSGHEMMRLMNQAKTLRDKAIISLFIDTGARCGEAASLRKQNIFDDYIKVDGKSGQREIPISEETRRILLALVATDGKSDYVFLGQRGPLTTSGIYRVVRHAFGKQFINNGGDTRALQKIMGHANITTTEIYVELSQEEIRAKHHQFSPLRSVYAAAQCNMFGSELSSAIKEAEAILAQQKEVNHATDNV